MAKRRRIVPLVIAAVALCSGAAVALLGPLQLPDLSFLGTMTHGPDGAANSERLAARTPDAPQAPADKPGALPKFDIARLAKDGVSVFAGQAQPNTTVTVMADGVAIATAEADVNGDWTLTTEHKFANAEPKLEVVAGARLAAATRPPESELGSQGASARVASTEGVTEGLLKKFETLVETAREEAKVKDSGPPKPAVSPLAADPKNLPEVAAPAAASTPVQTAAATPLARGAPLATAPTKAQSAIPVPITFVYREAEFTDNGRRAAQLLLEYLRIKKLDAIALSGHADERGSDIYNIELSQERLATVEKFLRTGGYAGKLNLLAKGKSEPFTGIDRSTTEPETLYQLDRRVELRVAN